MKEKAKMGRPKKDPGDVRQPFMTRYSLRELQAYERAARAANVTVREWMRVTLDKASFKYTAKSRSKAHASLFKRG